MRIILQKVTSSQVMVNGEIVGKIGKGLNLLVAISPNDTEKELNWMVKKCLELRLFSGNNNETKWEKSVQEIGGELLVISQFTLYGDCRKGRRPSFSNSASPEQAKILYDLFVEKLKQSQLKVETGIFGAMMEVSINNDGPVTFCLETDS